MDPLSVAASVIALLGAGGKIVSLLSKVTTIADAPALATDTLMGMTDISTALRQIGDFVNGAIKVPAERQKYIRLDYLLATLTGCLTTYSELEAIIDSLKIGLSGISVFDRVKWSVKEASIKTIVQRLEIYKSSLNLMLSIMQSTSIVETHQTVASLHSIIEQLLGSDDDLCRRFSRCKRARTLSSGTSNMETLTNNSADDNADNGIIRPAIVANRNTTEMGFTVDGVSADSRGYPGFKHSRPKTHPQTRSTRRKTATPVFSAISLAEIPNISAQPLPICVHEVGNSSWYAVAQAPTVPFSPTRAFEGMVQDLKKILSFKMPTKKERVASDLAPEQAPISRPQARNRQLLSGTRPPSETKPPSRTKPPSGSKPYSGTRVPSGNKPPSRTRLSSGNRPPSRIRQPLGARPPPGTRSLPRVSEGEPEGKDIIHGITVLCTLIDQHAEQFHGSEYTNYARQIIGETFGRWIFSGDNDADTILKYLSKTLAVYRHDPTDEGYQDHLAQIYKIADKQKRMIQRHPSKWRLGSFKDKMLRPSVSQDGVIVLDAEYTGMSTNLSSLPKGSFWN
ncbi:uncharacterized protein K441DRAFT_665166 [Cenococcum geophilum 1.58]|uniref:uncharacterized protein n=1 Tax=Cenococcum geophilum 1.58 TaxID=794803 RepID=UPI00358FC27F|nr:hypothetical protein K441DRAFT_665166 [Cenococcum geophilum 1.58]